MVNDQLLGYVKQQLSMGVSREGIATNLKSAGWDDNDVNEVFSALLPTSSSSMIPPTQPVSDVKINEQSVVGMNSDDVHHRSKKIIPVIAMLVLLCTAGAASSYVYYTGAFVTLPKLLAESVDKSKVVTSSKYEVNLSVDFSELKDIYNPLDSLSDLGIDSSKINFTINGASDRSDKDNPKLSSNILFNVGGYISVEAESRLIDNTLYMKLAKMPTLGNFPLPIPEFSQYENKWFNFPLKLAGEEAMEDPFYPSISFGDNYPFGELTPQQKDELYKILREVSFIKTVKRLSPETVGGVSSYHFSFDLDKEVLASYIESIQTYIKSIDKNNEMLLYIDRESIVQVLNQVKDFMGEIWIGRNDKLVHKIDLSFGVQPDMVKNEKLKIRLTSSMSDYGKPVVVVTPAESTPLSDLMEESMKNARMKGNEASIKANISFARTEAELFHDKNINGYLKFCSSNELKEARKLIENVGGTEFICRDAKKSYVISVKLLSSANYWCVDSTGASKSVVRSPSGMVCPTT